MAGLVVALVIVKKCLGAGERVKEKQVHYIGLKRKEDVALLHGEVVAVFLFVLLR